MVAIVEKTPAMISSSITPIPFLIFLSTILIGQGLNISKSLKVINEDKYHKSLPLGFKYSKKKL